MTDSSLVEGVARALAVRRYAQVGADGVGVCPPKENWVFCVDDARIAIVAMREPTAHMVSAGGSVQTLGDYGNRDIGTTDAEAAYVAMIDAALSENAP